METVLLWIALGFTLVALAALAARDVPFLTGPRVRAAGRVSDHQSHTDEGAPTFAPMFTFEAEGRTWTVTDIVFVPDRRPAVGDPVRVVYPKGRPDLARVPRPVHWAFVYAVLLALVALLVLRMTGRIA